MMKPRDPLQCTFADAERENRHLAAKMATAEKVAWFEEMLALAWQVGALNADSWKRSKKALAKHTGAI